MHWLIAHIGVLSAFATIFIWGFYAHLLWLSFRRGEKPMILIHQAGGSIHDTSCLVINLGRHPLHIINVHFVVRAKGRTVILRVSKQHSVASSSEWDWARGSEMKEGPLASGGFLSLGGFNRMLEGARRDGVQHDAMNHDLAEAAREVEIRVTAMFSSFNRPVGACRKFAVLTKDDAVWLSPKMPATKQLTSYWQRRRVCAWLKESQKFSKLAGETGVSEG